MPYKYFTSSSPTYFKSNPQMWNFGFQSLLDDQFSNSPTYYWIQEETTFGSGNLVDIEVRVNRAINSVTGEKLGDDFKLILFKDLTHATGIGYKYYFDENYWIAVSSENIKNLAASCLVRRCNSLLRWVDENGYYYSEPCSIDYKIARPRDEIGAKDPVTPAGYIDVFAQFNNKTKLVKANQRFLFGSSSNRIAYKVFGDGVRSFLNQKTLDDESAQLLQLTMGGDYVNSETDDTTNGIANAYRTIYTISASPTTISGNVGDIIQLNTTLMLNDNVVSKPITYASSSSSVASTSASGLITLIANGTTTIKSSMTSNSAIYIDVPVTVSASSVTVYEIRVSPTSDILLQGDTQIYSVYLYQDGVQQADVFTFDLANVNVPLENYLWTNISGNSFSIKNIKKYMTYPLIITCTTGARTFDKEIWLKGSW